MTHYAWFRPVGRVLNAFGHKTAPYAIEFMGTFYLVLAVGCVARATAPDPDFGGLAVGSTLMVLVFLGGHISGAHYNPAVTLGVWMAGHTELTFGKLFGYWIVQFFGGFLGGVCAKSLTNVTVVLAPGPNATDRQAVSAEMLWTFILVTVVLNVATTKVSKANSYFGLGIGFTVMAGAYSVGNISGAVFNPAVGTGIVGAWTIYSDGYTHKLWIYFVGPFIGASAASLYFRITNPQEYDVDYVESNSTPLGVTPYEEITQENE